jgi:tetratricopeptide (TPR) repeat protein
MTLMANEGLLRRARLLAWAWVVPWLLIAWLAPALGQQPSLGARVGLIIANGDYLAPKDRLSGPLNDAEILRKALQEQGFAGVDGDRAPSLLLNGTKEQMRQKLLAFRSALQAAGPLALGVLYFAGHGGADAAGHDNYLLSVDTPDVGATPIELHGIGVRWITDFLKQIDADRPPTIAIVIDACRTPQGALTSSGRGASPVRAMVRPDDSIPKGMLVALSTGVGQTAPDAGDYARVLADQIKASPGVPLASLFDEVMREVANKTGQAQIPVNQSQIVATVCLGTCNADPANLQRMERALANQAANADAFRQELEATRAETQELLRQLQAERTGALAEILQRASQPGSNAQIGTAVMALERGNTEAAESVLRTMESQAAARQDMPEAARLARYLGGLASTHNVGLAAAAFRRAAGYEPRDPRNWRLVVGLWRRRADLDESKLAAETLVQLEIEAAKTAPDDPRVQRDLADAQGKLGLILFQGGNQLGAQVAIREGLAILTKSMSAPRVQTSLVHEFVALCAQLGESLVSTGEYAQAKKALLLGKAAYKQFGLNDSSSVSAGLNFGELDRQLGIVYSMERNQTLSLQHLRWALAINERIAEAQPLDRLVLRGVALSQRTLGLGLVHSLDYAGATAALKRALDTTQRLRADDAKDAVLRYDLSAIHWGLGEAATGQKDYLIAVREYNIALGLAAELVVLNPKRLPWQRLKLRANSRMGDATNLYGAKERADATYRNSLVILSDVAVLLNKVGSKYERRQLAASADWHGNVLSALGDDSGALVAFRLGLAIRDDLLRANPDEQTELEISESCWRISTMRGRANVDAAEAMRLLRRGKSILQKRREESALPTKFADLERQIDAALATAAQSK